MVREEKVKRVLSLKNILLVGLIIILLIPTFGNLRMDYNKTFESQLGNTSVKKIPSDYFPEGSGHMFVIPDGLDKGKKMFYYDHTQGDGEIDETFVFVHGNPESSYSYKFAIDKMLEETDKTIRVIAMDHIGFGLSDQASYIMINKFHSTNLLHLVEYLDLKDVNLVVHDWGGPIGMGAFLQQPERVSKLVITNTNIFPIDTSDGDTYGSFPNTDLSWNEMARVVPDFMWSNMMGAVSAININGEPEFFADGKVSGAVMTVVKGKLNMLPKDQQYKYDINSQALRPKLNTQTSKQMNGESARWGHGIEYMDLTQGIIDNHDYWAELQSLAMKEWNDIQVVALIGLGEPLAKESVIDSLVKAFPTLKNNVVYVEDGSHFVLDRKYEKFAELLLQLID